MNSKEWSIAKYQRRMHAQMIEKVRLHREITDFYKLTSFQKKRYLKNRDTEGNLKKSKAEKDKKPPPKN